MQGRPLWFLGIVVTGWVALRMATLWPGMEQTIVPPAAAADRPRFVAVRASGTMIPPIAAAVPTHDPRAPQTNVITLAKQQLTPVGMPQPRTFDARPGRFEEGGEFGASVPAAMADKPVAVPGLPPLAPAASRSRWSGSAWAIAREGGEAALFSPLLGGSQAGVRVAYALDRSGRTAVFGRLATPLGRGSAEVALGGQWRPGRLPVTLYAEARASDGRVAPAVGLFGGGATPAFAGFRLEGYGQAGVIARERLSGYGDGQLRLVRKIGGAEAGVGTWAAAQRGAARVDIGPTIALPIHAKPLALRVTLDWRHRVAGNARPASGPSLSLGADF